MSMTIKITKEIAKDSFDEIVGALIGYNNSTATLNSELEYFRNQFISGIESHNLRATDARINLIGIEFEKMRAEFKKYIEKKYCK